VVTDPPFFDNVHYSELADFFYSWQQVDNKRGTSTRSLSEVQDSDESRFAHKLQGVFRECYRVLKEDGLLVFSYHHSRNEGWRALAKAISGAGFVVVNAHPVKGEMSVAAPKTQAKEPIRFDIVIVCRKAHAHIRQISGAQALESARQKLKRIEAAGFQLSLNDRRVVLYGQLLRALKGKQDIGSMHQQVEAEFGPTKRAAGVSTAG